MNFVKPNASKRKEHNRTKSEKDKKNKMVVLRKRQVAAVSLILLIGIAGYLNLAIQNTEENPDIAVMYTETSKRLGEAKMVNANGEEGKEDDGKNNLEAVGTDYFVNAKAQREKKRSESAEIYTGVLNAPGSDQAAKTEAQRHIEKLAQFTEAELKAEALILAKGYGDCVVFMGEEVTSVAVETNGLNEIDAAVICDLVAQSGNIKAEQVQIVEIKPN